MTSLWPYRSSEVKGQGAQWKPRYDFLFKVNSNCMLILYHFQDICPSNKLLIKLINLISMVRSGPNSIGYGGCPYQGKLPSKSFCVYLAPFWRYWQIKTLYSYCDLSRSSKVKGHGAKWKVICMFLSMNNSNYMSNRNRFKDIGTFLSKKSLKRSHVTRNALDDPKSSAMFCA